MPIQILLVDDDAFNRDGVRLFLSQEGFGVLEAGDEASAWQLASTHVPEAAIIDISIPATPQSVSLPGNSFGIRLAHHLKQAQPSIGVLLFSAYDDRGGEILDLIQTGRRGLAYKLKGAQPRALLATLHDVLAGRVVIDAEVQFNRRDAANDLLRKLGTEERPWVERVLANISALTSRELEVAERLAASHNTEGIARALTVTPKTAENYVGHVYDKLGLTEMRSAAPHLRQVVVLAKAFLIRDLRKEATP